MTGTRPGGRDHGVLMERESDSDLDWGDLRLSPLWRRNSSRASFLLSSPLPLAPSFARAHRCLSSPPALLRARDDGPRLLPDPRRPKGRWRRRHQEGLQEVRPDLPCSSGCPCTKMHGANARGLAVRRRALRQASRRGDSATPTRGTLLVLSLGAAAGVAQHRVNSAQASLPARSPSRVPTLHETRR